MNQEIKTREIMKKIVVVCLILFFSLGFIQKIKAQQDPNFTLYNFNMNLINPAVAGIGDHAQLNLVYRSQWIGVDDAPRTASAVYNTSIGNNLGLGVSVISDRVFILGETDLAVDLSYALQVSETTKLYFGMKFGGGFVSIDLSRAYGGGNDPLFNQDQSFFNPHIGAGLYLENEKYYLSVSTPNFLNGERYERNGNVPSAAVDNVHFYIGGGYNFKLNDKLILTPRFMMRSVEGAPNSYDAGASMQFGSEFIAGLNYRLDEMYSIYSMINLKDSVQLGVSYDITDRSSGLLNDDGSLEFMVRFIFK